MCYIFSKNINFMILIKKIHIIQHTILVKNTFYIVPTDAQYYKIMEMLKLIQNSSTCNYYNFIIVLTFQ